MRKIYGLLILLLLLTGLVACAGEGGQQETLQRLDRSQWPTPVSQAERVEPTPFPVIDNSILEARQQERDAARQRSVEAAQANSVAPTQTPAPTPVVPTPSPTVAAVEDAADSEAENAAVTAIVTSAGLNMRAGPNANTAVVGELAQDDEVTVLAMDEVTLWLKVRTAAGQEGWINSFLVSLNGSLENLPGSATQPVEKAAAVDDDEQVAYVSNLGLNLRAGPNASSEVVTQLRQDDRLIVLDEDPLTRWLNVRTTDDREGWVNPFYLRFEGETGDRPAVSATSQTSSAAAATAAGSNAVPAKPGGGRLVVMTASGGEIVVVNRDGTDLRYLTHGIDPALSPDGRQIAFTRWEFQNMGSVWAANLDGSGEQVLFGNIKQPKSPSWSPDGSKIAVTFQNGGTLEPTRDCQSLAEGQPDLNFWQVYDIELEYQEINGQKIPVAVCWRYPPDAHWSLRVVDLASDDHEDMPSDRYSYTAAWDPANNWRVISSGAAGLVWTDVNRKVDQSLTDDLADHGPVFSPDGRYIAVTYQQNTNWDIHRLNADGSGRLRLTKTPLYAIADGPDQWNNVAPAFSPDGSEIAFLSDRSGRWEVWVMNVDGSNQRPMFPEAINDQLDFRYDFNNERMLVWAP